jgi:hypothetical protein
MNIPSYDDWIAAERVTGAKLNKNIRDAGNFHKGVPFAWAYRTAAYSLANNSWVDLTMDTEKADNDGMYATSNGYLLINTPGWYFVDAQVRYPVASTVGVRGCRIRLNGADNDVSYGAPTSSDGMTVKSSTYVQCVAGDQLQVGAFQTTGAAVNLTVASSYYTFIRARWINA